MLITGMGTPNRRLPTPRELNELADLAVANRRSVERRLLGLPVRGAVGYRIEAALARRGYEVPPIVDDDESSDIGAAFGDPPYRGPRA